MPNESEAAHALESSTSEQSELDNLLIKLTTSALGFTVALGVIDNGSPWLTASWILLLLSIVAVLLSKFLSVEANRDFYLGRKHRDEKVRREKRRRATKIDSAVKIINYVAGAIFVVGAAGVVVHMLSTT